MYRVRDSRAGQVAEFARTAWVWAVAQVKKGYRALEIRYGPGYTHAMLVVAMILFFMPVPGITLLGMGLIVAVAETHRKISLRRNSQSNIGTEAFAMSIDCDVILKNGATAEQLARLGSALWRWCGRTEEDTGIYPRLDNQVLADLIAGKQPAPGQMPPQSQQLSDGIHFRVQDTGSVNRQTTIERLRREIPAEGIQDILVHGASWRMDEPKEQFCATS